MPAATSDEATHASAKARAGNSAKSAPAKTSARDGAHGAKPASARAKTPSDHPSAKENEGSVTVTEAKETVQEEAQETVQDAPQEETQDAPLDEERAERPVPGAITLSFPMDQVVTAATAVARLPLDAARKMAPSRVNGMKGVPVYLGIGGLAVVGVVEWPLAAAAGAGYAALRRWGPLKPGRGE
jgi:hypothetical protein